MEGEHTHRNSYKDSHSHSHKYWHHYSNRDPDPNGASHLASCYSNPHAYSYIYCDAYPFTHADRYPNSHIYTHNYARTDRNGNGYSNIYTNKYSHSHSYGYGYAHCNQNANRDKYTGAKLQRCTQQLLGLELHRAPLQSRDHHWLWE
jgi:hypothetical protein